MITKDDLVEPYYELTLGRIHALIKAGLLNPDTLTEKGKLYVAAREDGTIHKIRNQLPDGYCTHCRGHGSFTSFAFPDGSGAEYEDCVACNGTGRITPETET